MLDRSGGGLARGVGSLEPAWGIKPAFLSGPFLFGCPWGEFFGHQENCGAVQKQLSDFPSASQEIGITGSGIL